MHLFFTMGLLFMGFNPSAQAQFRGYDILVIAGQSNAVGMGVGPFSDDLDRPEVNARLDQLGRFEGDNLQILPARQPLQHLGCQNKPCGVGFGLRFARRYAQTFLAPDRKLLILPAALGGSGSFQWDTQIDPSPKPQFQDNTQLIDDLRERLRYLLSLPGENRIVALLWHQGETDAICLTSGAWCEKLTVGPDAFTQRLTEMFKLLRADTKEDFPILLGQFAPSWAHGWKDYRLRQNKSLIQGKLDDLARLLAPAAVVSSRGLTTNSEEVPDSKDNIHFSAKAQTQFGDRYFDAFSKLIQKSSVK